jgi:hypothetical protein
MDVVHHVHYVRANFAENALYFRLGKKDQLNKF